MNGYNLEYHKELNRSHILPNILAGARNGVYSQFLADIVISLFLYNERLVIEDIKINGIASYYAAVAAGMMAGFLSIYMDPFAMVLFTTTTYAYTYQFVNNIINKEEINIRPREILFDAGVSLILIYSFDPVAHNQYLRYQEKRHFIEPIHQRMDRNTAQNLFFIVLVNAYGFLKIQSEEQ